MFTPGWARRSSTSSAQIAAADAGQPQTSTAVQAAAIDPWTLRRGVRARCVPVIAERTARKITEPVATTGSSRASQSAKWVK